MALRIPCEKPLREPQVLKIKVVCAAFCEAGRSSHCRSLNDFLFFPGVSYLYRYISGLLILVCILNIVYFSSKSAGFGGLQVTRVFFVLQKWHHARLPAVPRYQGGFRKVIAGLQVSSLVNTTQGWQPAAPQFGSLFCGLFFFFSHFSVNQFAKESPEEQTGLVLVP